VLEALSKPDEYAGGQGPEHGYKVLVELLKEALRLPPPERLPCVQLCMEIMNAEDPTELDPSNEPKES
jgi:hypothetical protein